VLHVKTTKPASESTRNQIRKLVEDAQASRAHIQRTTDLLASYFVPVIVAIALAVFVVWIGIAYTSDVAGSSSPFPFALSFAVTVLVVACPCALALAVPTAVMAGMEVGAKLGILFKGGGEALERLHRAHVVVFDKTGTLTRGAPAVVGFQLADHPLFPAPCEGLGEGVHAPSRSLPCDTCAAHKFFSVVACAESASEHPVGKAIVHHARSAYSGGEAHSLSDFATTPGKGIMCKVYSLSLSLSLFFFAFFYIFLFFFLFY
jgi:Cu+-exporting ATPase